MLDQLVHGFMPGALGITAEGWREEEVLHVDDDKGCFGWVESYRVSCCGEGKARVDWRGGWGWRVAEVEAGGGVVEPEVFGRGADYGWRGVFGLAVGLPRGFVLGGHCCGVVE